MFTGPHENWGIVWGKSESFIEALISSCQSQTTLHFLYSFPDVFILLPAENLAKFCGSLGSEVEAVLFSILDLHEQLDGSSDSRGEVHLRVFGRAEKVGVTTKGQTQGVFQTVIMGTSSQ